MGITGHFSHSDHVIPILPIRHPFDFPDEHIHWHLLQCYAFIGHMMMFRAISTILKENYFREKTTGIFKYAPYLYLSFSQWSSFLFLSYSKFIALPKVLIHVFTFWPIMYVLHVVEDVKKHAVTSCGWASLWPHLFMAQCIAWIHKHRQTYTGKTTKD